MYLVHASLRGPLDSRLPDEARSLVRSQARDEDGIEHVAVHPDAHPHPVIGLYVRADGLAAAEERAAEVCRRALRCPEFGGWWLLGARVPMVAPFYESLLSASGPAGAAADGSGHGPLGPPENPSAPSDQRRK
ncbi:MULTISPECIES: hypothetical protein [Streptomyces]|uniref:YCII-related domain-containing protein n=1 Tax=Streptomyces noboritoensis TaxID=67337 RepID=A0ABV6TEQ5_9ACTN